MADVRVTANFLDVEVETELIEIGENNGYREFKAGRKIIVFQCGTKLILPQDAEIVFLEPTSPVQVKTAGPAVLH